MPASERGPGALCPTQGADSGTLSPPFSSAAPSSTLQAGELPGCCQAGESSPILMRMRRLGPGCTCPSPWHWDTHLPSSPSILPGRRIRLAEEAGVGGDRGWVLAEGKKGGINWGIKISPCPQGESLAAGGRWAWGDSPGRQGQGVVKKLGSSPPSALASPHSNQHSTSGQSEGGDFTCHLLSPHLQACFCRSTATETHGDLQRPAEMCRGQNSAAQPHSCDRYCHRRGL